ncbi:MAG: hypothetical protein R3F19_20610 [Verrucomicrobiales bacterium]
MANVRHQPVWDTVLRAVDQTVRNTDVDILRLGLQKQSALARAAAVVGIAKQNRNQWR